MKGVLPSNLELFRAVVEQGPDALIFADCEGTIRLWNARAEAIFGYAAAEAVAEVSTLLSQKTSVRNIGADTARRSRWDTPSRVDTP